MVATAEKHRTDAECGKDRRFGRPLLASAAAAAGVNNQRSRINDQQKRIPANLVNDQKSMFIERSAGSSNAAGSAVNAVFNAWGQVVSYTITEPNSTGGAPITVGQETIQYDALGRPLGEFQTYNFSGGAPGLVNTETTQHTFVYDANSGEVIQEVNEINGTDPVRYVNGPDGNVIVKEAGTGGSVTFNQTLYALQGADGSTEAITDGGGNVLERYVYDGLGNAQALQPNGTAYTADVNPGTSGTPGQQINEYFVGSTFDTSGNQTADGTHFNWTILYQGENYDAMPGVYITGNGVFNPRQQSLLAPDLSVIQQGISAYDPRSSWFDYAAGYGVAGSEIGLTVAGGFLGGPLGAIGVGAILSGINRGYIGGQTLGQSIEGGISDATGFTGIYAATYNEDLATGQNLNLGTGGRIMEGIFGALGIFGDAAGMAELSEAVGPSVANLFPPGGPAPALAVVGGGEFGGAGAAVGPGGWVGTPGWATSLAVFASGSNNAIEQDLLEQNGMSEQTLKQVAGIEEHHPIPEFMGGNADQELYPVSSWLHRLIPESFHSLLAENLAASEEFTFPAVSAGQKAWIGFFEDNPSSQDVAYRILLGTAQQMDAANGTDFASYVSRNIASGSYTRYPVEEAP